MEEVGRERERKKKKNSHLPGKKKTQTKKKTQQEYVAHPYNADVELGEEVRAMFAPVPADTVLPSQIPEGYNFRKYDRKTKKNWGGIAAVSFYCLSLILYFFVRVTKTMDLGRYMFYGVVVFFIEVRFFDFESREERRSLSLKRIFFFVRRRLACSPPPPAHHALFSFLPFSLSCNSPPTHPTSKTPPPDVRSHHHSHLRRQPGAGPGLRGAGEGRELGRARHGQGGGPVPRSRDGALLLGAARHHLQDVRGGAEGGAAGRVQGELFDFVVFFFFSSRESAAGRRTENFVETKKNSLFFFSTLSFFLSLSLSLSVSSSSFSKNNKKTYHQVTVYLCDDGKDPKKRRWCMAPGRGVVYVSGRTRASGEMNGKSANLNNCARQIYPDGQPIPPNEIICVFDADQVANPDFFLKMLYKFDAGDDVAMVLSPQSFYNTNLRADIFNHSNTHFWEYAQHGYDALGFISCTGTNFLIRSAAFRDAG